MTKKPNPTKGDPPKKGQLIPYFLLGERVPILYNDYQYVDLENPTAVKFDITTVKGE